MKTLKEILSNLSPRAIHGNVDVEIMNITQDSRKVEPGTMFVATKGLRVDGHTFISDALKKGAVAILCEETPERFEEDCAYIEVEDSREALGAVAQAFYDFPSEKLKLVGVTGTNGKTSTTTLLFNLFEKLGYRAGLISTNIIRMPGKEIQATKTTPDTLDLNALLNEMVNAGCDYVFMEVSSHAVHQRRIAGAEFAGAIFTNITHDHLDYHKTFSNYINAKKRFFDDLAPQAFALSNRDDRRGEVMLQNTKADKHYYSLRKPSGFKAKIIENSIWGLHLEMDGADFHSPLIGKFNAYNLLACYAAACLLGMDKQEILLSLSALETAEGRFEKIEDRQSGVLGIVDYAHTPDALENVLQTIDSINKKQHHIITVIGCGGDRDKQKRPIMARIACAYSDQVILTSDNPRSEDPTVIMKEMEEGILPKDKRKVFSIIDRKQAIRTAVKLAKKGDIIVLAGKGHEKYQEIEGKKIPFDDKVVFKDALDLTLK